jgi:hypothetical protein
LFDHFDVMSSVRMTSIASKSANTPHQFFYSATCEAAHNGLAWLLSWSPFLDGKFLMKQFGSPGIRGTPFIADASSRPVKRKGFLVRIVEALHGSRRLEARRSIRGYRHLIAEDFRNRPKIIAVNSGATEESNTDANRDNAPVHAERRALHHA